MMFKPFLILSILFITPAYAEGFTQKQIQAAQRPATGPETPAEQALRKCFEDAQAKDAKRPPSAPGDLTIKLSPRAAFTAECIENAAR